MGVSDKFKRSYKFEVSGGGLTWTECDKVTGIDFERTIIEHADAQGHMKALTGPKKLTHVEFHDYNPNCTAPFEWMNAEDPDARTFVLVIKDQSGVPTGFVTLYDSLPEKLSMDDLGRKEESEHGNTLRIACNIMNMR
jgi:hypothetical protein